MRPSSRQSPSPSGGFYRSQSPERLNKILSAKNKPSTTPALLVSYAANHKSLATDFDELSMSDQFKMTAPSSPSKSVLLTAPSSPSKTASSSTLKSVFLNERRFHTDLKSEINRFSSNPPALVNSFSACLPTPIFSRPQVESTDMACETEYNLEKKNFENLSLYQKWVDEDVDQYLKVF